MQRETVYIYIYDKMVKTTHFGFAIIGGGGKRYESTYIDQKNDTLKDAWITRHQINGSFEDYMSASHPWRDIFCGIRQL